MRSGGVGLSSNPLRVVLFAGLFIAGGLLIYRLVGVFEVLALAILIALILDPAVSLLVRLRFPRFLAMVAVVVGVILGVGLAGYIVLPLFIEQGSEFIARTPIVASRAQTYIVSLSEQYPALGETAGSSVASFDITSTIQEVAQRAGELYSLTTRGAGLLLQAIGAVVMALYMVSNPRPLLNGILALFPLKNRGRAEEILFLIKRRVSGWIIGQLAAMVLVFMLSWLGLAVLNVEYAFTFAILTGLLQIVPFFGPIISAVPPTLFAFAYSPAKALVVIIIYIAVHQIEAHLISPMVMARSVQIHPVVVIVAVLAMGDLLGLAGVILAVPTAAVLTVLLDELYVKPLGVPHDEGPMPEPPPATGPDEREGSAAAPKT